MKTVLTRTIQQATLTLLVDDTREKLFLSAVVTAPTQVTTDELAALVCEVTSLELLHREVLHDIAQALQRGEAVSERRVARGKAPQAGADGKFLFLVKKYSAQPEIPVDEKGFAHFSELHLFDNIAVNQEIARLYPPKPGIDGVDVCGKRLPAAVGKAAKISCDKSVTLHPRSESTPYESLTAAKAGFVLEQGGKVSIQDTLTIPGNLDLHFGNIRFVGGVKVEGDIAAALMLEAENDIVVRGDVQGARVTSKRGGVTVKGFVFGGLDGRIVSGASTSLVVAQQARVESAGDILIEREAIDCELHCTGAVRASRARIVGGVIHTSCGAEVGKLGNEAGKRTVINLESDVEASGEYQELLAHLATVDRAKELLVLHLGPFAQNPERINRVQSALRTKLEALAAKLRQVEHSRIQLLAKKSKLLEHAHLQSTTRLNVLGEVFPGVEIRSGESVHLIRERKVGPCAFICQGEKKEIREGNVEPLQCEVRTSGEKNDGKERTAAGAGGTRPERAESQGKAK